jgi:histidinol-phosphate/aromatic aminotransferase/cobyric acid decarboxylase-like protein/N-acyl-L-homoserine lactone synthetase
VPSETAPSSLANGAETDAAETTSHRLVVRMANDQDREAIYRIRHDVFAAELGQYATNSVGRLTDALDAFNYYIVVADGERIVGFVSITPPGGPGYSIDKYFKRTELPFPVDDKLYEVRLLTVPQESRRSLLALVLMYASFRWVEARGGTRIMAIGRREIRSMHLRVGLHPTGQDVQCGAVTYGLLQATMADVHASLGGIRKMLDRIEAEMAWEIGVAYHTPSPCYHGGKFFAAVGEDFSALEKLDTVISADVLDAWFPPSPKVLDALQKNLVNLLRTSPPTGCEGLVRAIAQARGVLPENILPGAGSSDLIFLALRHWLTPESRVLILDPTYGEYAHVLERVIRCRVDRLPLARSEHYRVDLNSLRQALAGGYDLVILVNPNSPTGQHLSRTDLVPVLKSVPATTRVWVDETYIEYAGAGESVETFASGSENVVVCKSMSKTYALSGARVAYLCAGPQVLESLRPLNPPWAVSLPAQVAAVNALADTAYYAAKYAETQALREALAQALRGLGWQVVGGVANFLLCQLPETGPDAETLVARCRQQNLFLRNAATMGTNLGERSVRIAVKDAATNRRMVEIITAAVR